MMKFPSRLCVASRNLLFVVMISICWLASASARPAQSIYRFDKAPEFMLLTGLSDGAIWGYTASIWQKNEIYMVFGHKIRNNVVFLSFYDVSAGKSILYAALKSPACRDYYFAENDNCSRLIDKMLSKNLSPKIAGRRFVYSPGGKGGSRTSDGAWRVEEDAGSHSSFRRYEDCSVDSLEVRLRDSAAKLSMSAVGLALTAVQDLFHGEIIREIAGVPEANIEFKTQFCDVLAKGLSGDLEKAGKWKVAVEPEKDRMFRVLIKSHSDQEMFYMPGVWWKAYFEIVFDRDDGNGRCSGANIYLYDTATCEAPLSDDPDSAHRDCFLRIPIESRAEFDLRDRLGRALVKAYGAPFEEGK